MSGQSDDDRIDNVAPGDIISLPLPERPEDPARLYKVVHKDVSDTGEAGAVIIVTLEGDGGETFDVELPADTLVTRTLESKWESPQSPTPHEDS